MSRRTTPAPTWVGRGWQNLSWSSPEQRALRLAVLVAPVLAAACAIPAGAGGATVALSLVTAAALAAAVRPDSHAPAVAVLLPASYWLLAAPGDLTLWALPAAILLLLTHCSAALVALGPAGMRVDAVTARTWGRRVAAVSLLTTLVWGLAAVLDGTHDRGAVLVTAAAAVMLAALSLRAASSR